MCLKILLRNAAATSKDLTDLSFILNVKLNLVDSVLGKEIHLIKMNNVFQQVWVPADISFFQHNLLHIELIELGNIQII